MSTMRRWLPGTLLLLAGIVGPAGAAISPQEALLRAKPAVTLVIVEVPAEVTLTCPGGREQTVTPSPFRETATGWFLDPSGWLITNAHVVTPAHKPSERLSKDLAERAARTACGERGMIAAAATAKVKLDPSVSVMLSNGIRFSASVAKYSPPVTGEAMSGRDLALLRVEAADMPTLPLGNSSTLKIGDRLHILGFPGVVLTHELLNASAKAEASVTNGAVSGFKQDRAGDPVIQTDAAAALGNSGGPAVDDQGRVVGVLTFVSDGGEGGAVQGFNFLIPVQAVREFLAGTAAKTDQPGNFNRAWHAALEQFFAGRYTTAAKSLAEANRLAPELPDVKRITAENAELIKNPPPRPFPWALVAALVALVSVAAGGAFGWVRWRRNRFRVRASEVARLVETAPEPPVILDVRDDQTYAKSPVRIPNARHVAPEALARGEAALTIEPSRTVVAYCT
jgi:S1-C subfamily serine protease